MKRLWSVVLVLLSVFVLTASSWAATYYVSTSGNNANPGTQDLPWRTVRHAENRVAAGDTVYVRGGTYGEGVYVDVSGNAQAPITFKAYPGETPVIDCGQTSWSNYYSWSPTGYDIVGSYIVVDGFAIRNAAVGVAVTGHDVTVKNCTVNHILHNGLYANNTYNVTFENNVVYDTANDWHVSGGRLWGGGISSYKCTGIVYRKNTVHNVKGEAIISFWGGTNILIEGNLSYNNWGAGIYIDGNRDVTVRYNMVYGTNDTSMWRVGAPSSGIIVNNEQPHNYPHQYSNHLIYGNVCAYNRYNLDVWRGDFNNTPYTGMKVFNNTFVEGYEGGVRLFKMFNQSEFKNNIIWQTNGTILSYLGQSMSGMQFDYNLWSRDPGAAFRGAHDPAWAVPNLAKSSGWTSLTPGSLNGSEFALQPGSPAIDRGCNLGSTYGSTAELNTSNFTGRNLTLVSQDGQGAGWEIGADVSLSGGGAPSLSAPKGLRVIAIE